MADEIVIHGAREHNLRDVDLTIPRDRLIVFTGLSGSGKSSLAFDTIYAEGQRRYVESLSAYARQFLGQMDKPDVDFIDGLSPAISIDQKSASRNPRSTVGTITEVYDYLRLLFARIGIPHDPETGERLVRQTPQQIVDRVMGMAEGIRFQVLAPVVRGRKGTYDTLLAELAAGGFVRAIVDGEPIELDGGIDDLDLARYEQHSISVVVDRLVMREGIERRLTESMETALGLAEGVAELMIVPRSPEEEPETITFSQHLSRPSDGKSFEELAPRNFSFNSPYGACRNCDGLGSVFEVDPRLVIPNPDLSLGPGSHRPLGQRSQSLLPAFGGVGGRESRHTHGSAVGKPGPGSPGAAAVWEGHRRPAGRGEFPQPLRTLPPLQRPVRGGHPLSQAPSQRVGLRFAAIPRRGVHATSGLPGVRRGPAEPPVAGGDRWGSHHRRSVLPVDPGIGSGSGLAGAVRARPDHCRAGTQGDKRPASLPSGCGAGVPDPGALGRDPQRGRGPAHPAGPRRSVAAWWGCSMCWTSRQ